MITRTDYPQVVLASALSSYGGSMGFWIGLGVIQLVQLLLGGFKNGIFLIRKIKLFLKGSSLTFFNKYKIHMNLHF